MTSVITRRTECRICGGRELRLILSLGPMPLANGFLEGAAQYEEEVSYPLDVFICENCFLLQLLDVVDREVLFRHYIYVTGTSDTIAAHNARYAAEIVEMLKLGSSDLVIEAASNDGSLLKCFQKHGVRTLGIDPATNIAAMAERDGVETINAFLDGESVVEVRRSHGPAKVVVANNVLAHVDDPRDFLRACSHLLDEDGLIVVEVPAMDVMVERLEYDTIYHEHLSYFSVTSILALCESVGLSLIRVDRVTVNGGSLRAYAAPRSRYAEHSADVLAMVEVESALGISTTAYYEAFGAAVARNRLKLRELLTRLKAEGSSVAGYAAPAKGNTLLCYCGIGPDLLPYTVDKNPLKVGLETPGMHIPVLPVSAVLERQPDYLLVLAWNFFDEIVAQQQEYRSRGGRFIDPIPEPQIIE